MGEDIHRCNLQAWKLDSGFRYLCSVYYIPGGSLNKALLTVTCAFNAIDWNLKIVYEHCTGAKGQSSNSNVKTHCAINAI